MAVAGLFFVSLGMLVNGCAMTPQAEAEWRWRQANPDYRFAIPQDPGSQWTIFGFPDR
jgi:hypothetical protein